MKNSTRRKHIRLKAAQEVTMVFMMVLIFADVALGLEKTEVRNGNRNNSATHDPPVKDSRGLFSPRMDYDQWKPLGRGDPLQNDPTYDYVPPVLERVHYWIEPPNKKQELAPEGKKSEILVLGVSSKKPSSGTADGRKDTYETFLKYIDGPKYHHHFHNSFGRPSGGQRPSHSYHSQFFKNKYEEASHKSDDQRMPYTVLVPPPIPPPHMEMPIFNSQQSQMTTQRPVYKPSTTTNAPRSSVSVQEANLVYHSSSGNQWNNNNGQYASLGGSGSQYVTWRAPSDTPAFHNSFQEASTKGNPIVFTKTNANASKPVVFPGDNVGRIVFEQHSFYKGPDKQYNDIVVAPPTSSPTLHVLHVGGTQPAVTHMTVGSQAMHKGQVSDDTIGNTYVNIGKPNAHIQKDIATNKPTPSANRSPNGFGNMIQMPIAYTNNQINSVYVGQHNPNVINNGIPFGGRRPGPITEDVELQTMQTMHPPPPHTTKISTSTEKMELLNKKLTGSLQLILQKEASSKETTPYIFTTTPTTTVMTTMTTTPKPTTTTVASLTTDPLFKHYKQPVEPMKGPLYLIIQGHSKVKTYGASQKDTMNGISMPETNEISQVGDKFSVKHLHNKKEYKKDESGLSSRAKGARTLKDLLDSGIGSVRSKEIQEAELGAGYEVVEEGSITTEKYHQGIVESEELDFGDRFQTKKRPKRQLDEIFPVVEDAVESYVYDYLKKQGEGSGVGAIIASAITSDSADDYVSGLTDPLEDDEEEEDDDGEDV